MTRFPYEIVRLAEDIAGGLMVTMPSQKDFHSDTVVGRNGETIGGDLQQVLRHPGGCDTEDRQRILRFIENLCLGAAAVGYRTESMHGAGSPQAQRIMIARQGNIQAKKQMAKEIAGIIRTEVPLLRHCCPRPRRAAKRAAASKTGSLALPLAASLPPSRSPTNMSIRRAEVFCPK